MKLSFFNGKRWDSSKTCLPPNPIALSAYDCSGSDYFNFMLGLVHFPIKRKGKQEDVFDFVLSYKKKNLQKEEGNLK